MIIKKTKSIREQVYDRLKDLIITGEIGSGERIVEVEYAEKFQVSRTPVREALRMLELEGLVEVNIKGGVLVKEITPNDIREIYKIRIALEGVIIEEIINKNHEGLEKIEKLLDDTDKIVHDNKNSKEVIQKFTDFNEVLYSLSGLSRAVDMIKNLNLYLLRFRKISINSEARREIAYEEHRQLVKFMRENKLQDALKLNRKHLEDSMNFILASLKKHGTPSLES